MFDPIQDVKDFHERFGLEYSGPPRVLPQEVADFRLKFMQEELDEWTKAQTLAVLELSSSDVPDLGHYSICLEDQLDALVDLLYVLMGTVYLQGLSPVFSEAWRRVHEANMKKVRAEFASQSKRGSALDVVKPLGWEPPVHSDLVEEHDLRVAQDAK